MRGGLPARELPVGTQGQVVDQVRLVLAKIINVSGEELDDIVERAFAEHRIVDETDTAVAAKDQLGEASAIFLHRPVVDAGALLEPLTIIGEGDGWIAVNKPSGMATMPRGAYVARSAVIQARRQLRNDLIIPAHRLDRLTSGVLLLVTDPARRAEIQGFFARGLVTKSYCARTVALGGPFGSGLLGAHGRVDPAVATLGNWQEISLRLEKPSGSLRMHVVAGKPNSHTRLRGKPALGSARRGLDQSSELSPLARRHGKPANDEVLPGEIWRWQLVPTTGKTHQLRVTLAQLGHPIIGDPLYPEILPQTDVRWQTGMRLHARRLVGPGFDLSAQLPDHWEVTG